MHSAEVSEGPAHLGNFSGRQEGDWVPFPIEVQYFTRKPHRVVRGSQVILEESLTAWWNHHLLSASLKMYLRMGTIPALHSCGAHVQGINQKLSLAHLIDLLFKGNDPEFAQAADQFEPLHVQCPEAR